MSAERPTRGRPGRIDGLPPEIKERLDALLRGGVTQVEILRRLEEPLREAGERPLSAASLNRYATKMERVGAKIRETRALADTWTAKFGERPTSEVGQLTIEALRTLAFDIVLRTAGDDGEEAVPLDIPEIKDLALAVQRLERAAALGRKREREMRAAFAEEAETAARKHGISPDAAAAIREALTTVAE